MSDSGKPFLNLDHPRDFFFEVAAGNIFNHESLVIIGHDNNIGTSIATIGNNLGAVHTYSTSADIDSISSDDASDTHDIVIEGLDVDYNNVAAQTVTLNGQTRVALPTPLFRITSIYNDTTTPTLGIVWVYVNTALTAGKPSDETKIRKSIHHSEGSIGNSISNEVSTSSSYTIPAGKTGFIVFGKLTVSDSKALSLHFWVRPQGRLFKVAHLIDLKNNSYDYFFKSPTVIPEKTDLEIRASVDAGTANVAIAYSLILVGND